MQQHSSAKPKAFTLVEMLVVVFVIGILVTIVVGVSKVVISRAAKDQTIVSMKVILGAVEAYHEVKGYYPGEPPDPDDPSFPPVPSVGWIQRDWQAYVRGRNLYQQLDETPLAQAKLRGLGKDAILSIYNSWVFVDGFGKYMEYYRDLGAGATPLVLSAGADGDFNTQEDNIRSDDR
jgi:prepilin-type N-terminal cleavage/methylation domain-containing protein